MCGLGEALDRIESSVPQRGELSHGSSGLVESAGFHPVENLSTLFAPPDKFRRFQYHEMLGNGLTGERHEAG